MRLPRQLEIDIIAAVRFLMQNGVNRSMDPRKHYEALIAKRRQDPILVDPHNKDYVYSEKHHIVPVCCGGLDEENNLIRLTYKEHAFAHHMLWKMYPNNGQLALAFEIIFIKNPPRRGSKGLVVSSAVVSKLKVEAAAARKKWLSSLSQEQRDKITRKRSKKVKQWHRNMPEHKKRERAAKISKSLSDPNSGLKSRSPEKIAQWKSHISEAQKKFSQEKKASIQAKCKKTRDENWQSKTDEEKQAIHKKRSDSTKLALSRMTEQQKEQKSKRCSIASRSYWDNLTEEERQEISNFASNQMTLRFQTMSESELESFRQKVSVAKQGSRCMMKDGQLRIFMKHEIDQAIKDGWEFHGPDRSQFRGTSYWNDGIQQKRIHKQEEEQYRQLGWTKGRLRKPGKKYNFRGAAGRKWIHKNGKVMQIPGSELNKYLALGWILGRK